MFFDTTGPVIVRSSKLLIYGLFQKGRVLAQDGVKIGCAYGAPRQPSTLPGCSVKARKEVEMRRYGKGPLAGQSRMIAVRHAP